VLWVGGASCLYTLTSSSLSKWELDDSWEHQVLSWDAQRPLTDGITDAIWVSTRTEIYIYIHYRSKVWGHEEMSLFVKVKHYFIQ